jgi:hypothetical protein
MSAVPRTTAARCGPPAHSLPRYHKARNHLGIPLRIPGGHARTRNPLDAIRIFLSRGIVYSNQGGRARDIRGPHQPISSLSSNSHLNLMTLHGQRPWQIQWQCNGNGKGVYSIHAPRQRQRCGAEVKLLTGRKDRRMLVPWCGTYWCILCNNQRHGGLSGPVGTRLRRRKD